MCIPLSNTNSVKTISLRLGILLGIAVAPYLIQKYYKFSMAVYFHEIHT